MIRYSRLPQLSFVALHLIGCGADHLDLGDDRRNSTDGLDGPLLDGSASTPGAITSVSEQDAGPNEPSTPAPSASPASESSSSNAGGDSSTENVDVPTMMGSNGELADAGPSPAMSDGSLPTDPYAPREGSFKVLAYSKTHGFRAPSIYEGLAMLEDAAAEYGFEVVSTEDNDAFTPEGLAEYELVIFLNTSGDVFDPPQKEAFEQWMTERQGAFLGIGRAADTELNWNFYHELIGQYYDGHTIGGLEVNIEWAPGVESFPAVSGLPSPWLLHGSFESWFYFDSYLEWSAKPGFQILSTVTVPALGAEGTVTTPVSFEREWGNFRSFYTSLGNAEGTLNEPLVRQHMLGGLLWAVRREHWLD